MRSTRRPLGPALAVVLLAPWALSTGAQGTDRSDGRDDLIAALEVPGHEPGKGCEVVRVELHALRPLPIWPLLEVIAARGIPRAWGSDPSVRLDTGCLQVLRQVLVESDRKRLLGALREVARTEADLELRDAALGVLAEFATSDDLRLLVSLSTPLEDGVDVLDRPTRKRFAQALSAAMERDAGCYVVLPYVFDEVHKSLRNEIVSAVESAAAPESLGTLASFLGATNEMDTLVLGAIARSADSIEEPIEERIKQLVRIQLTGPNERLRRAAARAAASVEDYGALPELLEMLESREPDVRDDAHRALRQLTRLGFRADPLQWNTWYAQELDWREQRYETLRLSLDDPDASVVKRAIAELAGHRLYRHELAAVLGTCLDRPEPDVVRMACEGLAQLESPVAVPGLAACLENPAPRVREAALAALRRITGRDLPGEPELWLERS